MKEMGLKSKFNVMNHLKCVLYDETNMRLYDMYITEVGMYQEPIECTTPTDISRNYECGSTTYSMEGTISEEPIELDPTTMKRIAKYNKEKELEELQKEIERLTKGINEIIQYINSLELGSDHEETYNKDGYLVDVYDIEKMLVELIGSDSNDS